MKKYYMVLKNDEELLNKYLYNLNNDILKTPHILFIKPIISGYILSEKSITIILRYIKNKGIDFNSEDYFQNRNDDLQGVDLISGCLCFTIYYFVQNKKIFLEQQDIAMYSAIVINARKMGWEINNSHKNKKNIQDLLLILISNGHNEIQPIYNALFEDIENVNLKQEEVERHVISDSLNQSKIITESKQDNNFSNSNKDEITGNNHNISETLMVDDSINNFIILLNSLAINGFIDNSFLNKESQISSKIYNMQKSLNYESAEKMLERFGFKVDTIEGGVEYDIFKGDVFELNTNELRVKDDFLNSNISNFSTRTYNRLKRYGVRTYDDLLNLNIDEFKYSNGVGVGVIEEVQKEYEKFNLNYYKEK